jgi:predicted nucleic acid-binding protein
MTDKIFLDTNVLVYAYDTRDAAKQKKAQEILTVAISSDAYCLSVQVLGEFFNVVTRQIQNPMSSKDAKTIVDIISLMPVVDIDLAMVNRAIDTHVRYHLSYWDALILAAAEKAECRQVYSEDFNPEQLYHDISVTNPFQH